MQDAAIARADVKYGDAAGNFGDKVEIDGEAEGAGLADFCVDNGWSQSQFRAVEVGNSDDQILLKGGDGKALNENRRNNTSIGARLADEDGFQGWAEGGGEQ